MTIKVCQLPFQRKVRKTILLSSLGLAVTVLFANADQVEMQNGDRYVGKVLSLNSDTLVLQNEILGTVRLPRAKVAAINLGASIAAGAKRQLQLTNTLSHAPALGLTNQTSPDLAASFRQLGTNNPLIQQVQTQFLSDAGPEANKKFNELLGGLMSGKLSVTDIRAEAKSAAEQIRAVRKDLGEDAGGVIDGYLAILDSFVKETEPAASPGTNALVHTANPKAPLVPESN
ncbi:MAG TPA: hypothetical protein VN578_06725 [Candidatus Binatia bacterium]|jgi:hypothetical protein|nr:hypothetical protein [Candidatus Binatia bacterium]